MGSLSRLIKEKGGELGGGKAEQIKVQQIHYTKLKESDLNFYTRSEDDVIELADTMLIAGGILQPLIVRKTDMSEYEILAGHKRRRASVYNVERGYKEYEFLPCIVIDMSGLMAKKISEKILAEQGDDEDDKLLDMIAEYIVICTNSTASESSHYEKMMQAVRLSKILPAMLDNEELKGRALRTEIAKEMKCGNGQVGRYQSIYNNLIPEALERFKNGRLTVTLASEMAGLDDSVQKEALKNQEITSADIEILKKRNHETVSESDTEKTSDAELLHHKENGETVSESDTEKTSDAELLHHKENGETVSESDTEKIHSVDSITEYTKAKAYNVFQMVFDDMDSGFPQDVWEELLNGLKNTGGNVSLMVDIFDKALPFENMHIRIERVFGYAIHFKDEEKKMTVALWPFWRDFIGKYKYNESLSPSDNCTADESGDSRQNIKNDKAEIESAAAPGGDIERTAAGDKETAGAYSTEYTPEDVRRVYDEQAEKMRQFKDAEQSGNLAEPDKWQYKKARIILEGLAYVLECI